MTVTDNMSTIEQIAARKTKMGKLKSLPPAHTVCFSGHRPDRLPGNGDPEKAQALAAALRERIEDAIRHGKDTFCHGAMAGFDIFAAERHIPSITRKIRV